MELFYLSWFSSTSKIGTQVIMATSVIVELSKTSMNHDLSLIYGIIPENQRPYSRVKKLNP